MIVRPKYIRAFTLIETVTALTISGAIFIGVFAIFSILNNKFEAELVRGELVTYCNYVLDDMSQSIRLADVVLYNNNAIITKVNRKPLHTYTLSKEEGIIKDGIPIYEEMQNNPNNSGGSQKKHLLSFIPKKKNGFIKYILDEWSFDSLEQNNNTLYYSADGRNNIDGNLKESAFVIKMHAKLIMGWDEDCLPGECEKLDFERFAFSPGVYFNKYFNKM